LDDSTKPSKIPLTCLIPRFGAGGGDNEASNPAPWTEDDEYELVEQLRTAPIDIGAAYGQFEAQKKRDVELAYQKMTPEEKAVLRQKMTKINAANADYDECAQPSSTPV
jgi:hypothetical protein